MSGARPDTDALFPCTFPVKVMGPAVPEFGQRVREIVRRHVPEVEESDFSSRASRGGRYSAITVIVQAQSREQMDALYRELSACELVTLTL
ncbi:MAG: YbeD family protein [Ectothiorhodospira sp.]